MNLVLTLILVLSFVSLIFLYFIRLLHVVPPHEAHVISGMKAKTYDGTGRYILYPLIQDRRVVSKKVTEIAVPRIKLHDKDHLPFAVEISCKVQISDPKKAVETLGQVTPTDIRPIVDDVIQSAARSQAMQHNLVTIMRERDTIEGAIYRSTADSLSRLGIRLTLFDIKNIVDVDGSTVIKDLERVRSAEVIRKAREAESIHTSQADIVEEQNNAEAEIQRQESQRKSKEAKIKQEQYIAEQQNELTLKKMEIVSTETRRQAEIEQEKMSINAEAEAEQQRRLAKGMADSRIIEAEAEAEAMRIKAQAEADGIRMKLEAEAVGTAQLAEAFSQFDEQGISVKLAEIYADAQKEMSGSIAKGLENNSKMFIPMSEGKLSNTLMSLIPSISMLKESGISLKDAFTGKSNGKHNKDDEEVVEKLN